MIKPLFSSIFFCLSLYMYSQENMVKTAGWKTIYTDQAVEFSSLESSCVDDELGTNHNNKFLMVKNKTGEKISISWFNEIYYNGRCVTCTNQAEYTEEVILEPGETLTGDCNGPNAFLKIFTGDNAGWIKETCSDFKINHVKVTTLAKN